VKLIIIQIPAQQLLLKQMKILNGVEILKMAGSIEMNLKIGYMMESLS
jgi:hypothetical protein